MSMRAAYWSMAWMCGTGVWPHCVAKFRLSSRTSSCSPARLPRISPLARRKRPGEAIEGGRTQAQAHNLFWASGGYGPLSVSVVLPCPVGNASVLPWRGLSDPPAYPLSLMIRPALSMARRRIRYSAYPPRFRESHHFSHHSSLVADTMELTWYWCYAKRRLEAAGDHLALMETSPAYRLIFRPMQAF